jgi:hypothetical protein
MQFSDEAWDLVLRAPANELQWLGIPSQEPSPIPHLIRGTDVAVCVSHDKRRALALLLVLVLV